MPLSGQGKLLNKPVDKPVNNPVSNPVKIMPIIASVVMPFTWWGFVGNCETV